MYLTQLESDGVRHFLNNGRRLHGQNEAEIAHIVHPPILRATLNRLLTTAQRWKRHQAEAAIHGAAAAWGFDPAQIWSAIVDPCRYPIGLVHELVSGEFWSLLPGEIAAVSPILDQFVMSPHYADPQPSIFGRSLPWHLLDDDVVRAIHRELTYRSCMDPESAYSRLAGIAEQQRESFMLSEPTNPLRPPVVSVLISGLLDMLNLRPPFDKLEFDAVAAAVESVAIDAVRGRGILVCVINDLASSKAREWASLNEDIESITLAGTDDLLIVRRRGRFTWRVFRREDNRAWPLLREHYRTKLIEAASHACHDLTVEASAAFLLELVQVAREGRNNDSVGGDV